MTRRSAEGFTLIELTLAMSFVAVLLVSVAMLSIQLTNQYSRGLTLKEVAQAGTEVSNDIKRTMGQSQLQQGVGVRTKTVSGGATVLCTGTYSYIASSPASLEANNGNGDANAIRVGAAGSTTMARLAKVRDLGGTLCATDTLDRNKNYETTDVSELLSGGSRLLSVRQLSVSPNGLPAAGNPLYAEFQAGKGIYTVSLTIGAGLQSEIESSTGTCKPPSDIQSNLDYCAINSFEFATRVGSSNRQ